MTTTPDRTTPSFVLTRDFNAPRERVFAALTQVDHLQHWMCPVGLQPVPGTMDLRPGGSYHYGMRAPDGSVSWGRWIFRDIVAPERLVTVVHFSDAAGGVTRHPMAPTWPLLTLSTTTLTDIGGGRTHMHLDWRALNATEAEEQVFNGAHAGMAQGWGGTMAVLDQYLGLIQQP